MLGYTGTFEGAPISVQTTGMGAPSAASSSRNWSCSAPPPDDPRRHVRRSATGWRWATR